MSYTYVYIKIIYYCIAKVLKYQYVGQMDN